MKKLDLIQDCFELSSPHPPYPEVKKAMEDLKTKGWKKLEYSDGVKHLGRDPGDDEYQINAKIYGYRVALTSDVAVTLQFYREKRFALIKEITALTEHKWRFLRENKRKIGVLSKELSHYIRQSNKLAEKYKVKGAI